MSEETKTRTRLYNRVRYLEKKLEVYKDSDLETLRHKYAQVSSSLTKSTKCNQKYRNELRNLTRKNETLQKQVDNVGRILSDLKQKKKAFNESQILYREFEGKYFVLLDFVKTFSNFDLPDHLQFLIKKQLGNK